MWSRGPWPQRFAISVRQQQWQSASSIAGRGWSSCRRQLRWPSPFICFRRRISDRQRCRPRASCRSATLVTQICAQTSPSTEHLALPSVLLQASIRVIGFLHRPWRRHLWPWLRRRRHRPMGTAKEINLTRSKDFGRVLRS